MYINEKYCLLLFLVKLRESQCQFVIITPQGLMKTLHLVTVIWAHVEDTVRWESVCLCQARLFRYNSSLGDYQSHRGCSSKCRSGKKLPGPCTYFT